MALYDILKQFNWVDIFVIILLLRTGYIAVKTGLPAELFKGSGLLSATYLSLHYYTVLSGSVSGHSALKILPSGLLDFISFIILAAAGYLVFVILRKLLCRFIKVEAVPNLNKWGGLMLGIFRAALLLSLLMFTLVISPFGYLRNSVRGSYSGNRILKVAPAVYSSLWNGIASKFMTGEKINEQAIIVPEEDQKEIRK